MLEEQFEQIEEQHTDMRTILDNMPHSVIWLDKDRNVRMRSKRVTEVHCMKEEEYQHVRTFYDHVRIVGRRGDLGPYSSEEELNERIQERVDLLTNEQDINRAIRIHFPTHERSMQVRVAQLPDGGCILGQFEITDQVAIENALEKAHSELEKANAVLEARVTERTKDLVELQKTLVESERQATLGNLAAKLCHELRNPLSGLKLSMHVIRSKVGDNPTLLKAFERSDRTLVRCTNILNDFYDFALPNETKIASVDLRERIEAACRQLERPDDVTVDVNQPGEAVFCEIDNEQFGKALEKIIENAVQAVSEAGQSDTDRQVKVELVRSDSRATIVVSDSGVGMDEETIDQALEPLFSTRGFGVGLGLPIAKHMFRAAWRAG